MRTRSPAHAVTTPVVRVAFLVALLVAFLAGPLVGPAPLAAAGAPVGTAGTADDPVGVWPLRPDPEVVRRFEAPDHAYGPGHRGVDLAATVGQPVLAALGGRVSYAGRVAGRGVVVVDHGTTRTTYEPVTASAAVGTVVVGGQELGTLELAASHCRPRACLHWGWVEGETYLDPLRLVGGGPVRLVPWEGLDRAAAHPYAGWSPPASRTGGPVARARPQALGWAWR